RKEGYGRRRYYWVGLLRAFASVVFATIIRANAWDGKTRRCRRYVVIRRRHRARRSRRAAALRAGRDTHFAAAEACGKRDPQNVRQAGRTKLGHEVGTVNFNGS